MQAVNYWQAWSLWWSGAKLEDFAMWGIPMLWWARIGKLLQFAGGAVVIIDLIGPARFATLGRRIKYFSRLANLRDETTRGFRNKAGRLTATALIVNSCSASIAIFERFVLFTATSEMTALVAACCIPIAQFIFVLWGIMCFERSRG